MGQKSSSQPADSDGSSRLTGRSFQTASQSLNKKGRLVTEQLIAQTTVHQITHEEGTLAVRTFGNGPDHVVLFHGYGQDGNAWLELIAPFQDQYTFVLIDLYFHGQSHWSDRKSNLTTESWINVARQVLDHLQIQDFILGAFSIGAKFALSLCQTFGQRIKRIILIAPDGIKSRFWYNLATGTAWGNNIFKRLVTKPRLLFDLTNLLHSLRLLDRSLLGFVASQMNTRQKRLRVYKTWTVFAGLKPDLAEVIPVLNSFNIAVEVFIGKYDRVISRKHIQPLLQKVKHANLYLLEASHQNLLSKVADHYRQNELLLA